MRARQLERPFGDEHCDDVPLTNAPLVRVLSQLRFERMSALGSPEAATEFARALRDAYPYLDSGAEINMVVSGGRVDQQPTAESVWRLRSADKTRTISLGNGSLSLETSSYSGRTSFCAELAKVAGVLRNVTHVPGYTRLGVRYTNQIADDHHLEILPDLVRREILGIYGIPLGEATLSQSLSQAAFNVGNGSGLLAHWGELSPGGGFDPTLTPLSQRSWVLDLDAFTQKGEIDSASASVEQEALVLAERAYRFFRWAVTPQFLERYGGGK